MQKDFSNQDLRGRSFKGQYLTGANFSGANIRGVNFKGSTLVGVDFSNAQAGLRGRFCFMWFIISLILSFLVGYLCGFSGFMFYGIMDLLLKISESVLKGGAAVLNEGTDKVTQTFSITIFSVTIVFFLFLLIPGIISIKKRKFNTCIFLVALALSLVVSWMLTVTLPRSDLVLALTLASTLPMFFALNLAVVLAVALAVAVVWTRSWAIVVALAVAMAWAMAGSEVLTGVVALTITWAGGVVGAVALGILSSYIAWKTFKEDEQFTWIRKFSLYIVSWGGTNFQSADLTSANFRSSILSTTTRL